MKKLSGLFCVVFVFAANVFFAQNKSSISQNENNFLVELKWKSNHEIILGVDSKISVLSFNEAFHDAENGFAPFYCKRKKSPNGKDSEASLKNIRTEVLSNSELFNITRFKEYLSEEFDVKTYSYDIRKENYSECRFIPIRYNKNIGQYEKLVSFELVWKESITNKAFVNSNVQAFGTNSVLATGTWFKIAVTDDGVYKMDKNFLTSLGLNLQGVDPRNIKIYGNGGHLLPENNSVYRTDDLAENAIYVSGEGDGVFDNSDFILFYGQRPGYWNYNPSAAGATLKYNYVKHHFSDTTFYFVTIDNASFGKRISSQSSLSSPATYNCNSFDDYAFHENETSNLVKSGREFYGEFYDILLSYSFGFSFPNIVQGDSVRMLTSIAGRYAVSGFVTSYFNMSYPNGTAQIPYNNTGTSYTDDIARPGSSAVIFPNNSSSFSVTVSKPSDNKTGWLNYIRLNARRNLIMVGNQMGFRDYKAIGKTTQYQISGLNLTTKIWNVSDPLNIKEQQYNLVGNNGDFIAQSSSLDNYFIFGNTGYLTPTKVGLVPNQNLHSHLPVDLVIVTHPMFLSQAQQLASYHIQYDTLSSHVVTTDDIYNEFSSGAQDATAIRDYIRMLYERSTDPNETPRYVLLFGDGSYNNKNRNTNSNTNFIPTVQTDNSLSYISSKVIDDYYAFLGPTEGVPALTSFIDVAVGRLPVHSTNEANVVVQKILNYRKQNLNYSLSNNVNNCNTLSGNSMGDWRNTICFIADDEEGNEFQDQCEDISNPIAVYNKTVNINKIYLDAFNQISTPGGQRYPDAVAAINKQIEKGALIVDFNGHGGELGLTGEDAINLAAIQGWKNVNNLPMFLTVTCEFSRFDDPGRTSAGEYVLLNSGGGGIALFTTTRLATTADSRPLSYPFFDKALNYSGKVPKMGDLIFNSKVVANGTFYHFSLLGDPALPLAYPKETVYTTEINSHPVVVNVNDTLRALSKVTVKGYVGNESGTKLTSFNGGLYPTVYDKSSTFTTLGNDGAPYSTPMNFNLQRSIIYKGLASVTNGDFEFSFIVPKDINYAYGIGKISYYAQNGLDDAAGYYNNILIGGSDTSAKLDTQGPEVKLFMNDNKFVFGGTTNENPTIYAEIFDSIGVNTVGNGIGHDIVAVLDAQTNNSLVLNDYYQSDVNSYQSGKVSYPLSSLSEGNHTLSLKVWDVQNNSSSSYTEFVVAQSSELALKHVLNYPNPFSTNTQFYLEHNQCCSQLNVEIQIYTVSGKLVKTIQQNVINSGYRTEGIAWDGKDDYGDKIGRGVYVYKVRLKDSEGNIAQKIEKLVILN